MPLTLNPPPKAAIEPVREALRGVEDIGSYRWLEEGIATNRNSMATAVDVRAGEPRETDTYRLIVFNRSGTAVLLKRRALGYELPVIDIPRFSRPAQEITTVLRERWHIPSVVLFSGLFEKNPQPVYFAALEAQVRSCTLPEEMDWFPAHHAILHLVKDGHHSVLETSYLRTTNRATGDDPEPFSRIGWLSNLQEWVRTVIRPLGMELKDFLQLNGCETFSLIRFDTTGRPVWFKAVGKPKLHEHSITTSLVRKHPEYFPNLIGDLPMWHAWLMEDPGGCPLEATVGSEPWGLTALTLGRMQVAFRGDSESLIAMGCKDLRISTILDKIDVFFDVMADLMGRQPKSPPPTLSSLQLKSLGNSLKNICYRVGELDVPNSLGHRDLNPGNVLVRAGQCVFIDWAEAYVGHPFPTFEYLRLALRKYRPGCEACLDNLAQQYSTAWEGIVPTRCIADSLRLVPPLAALLAALGSDKWQEPDALNDAHSGKYLRSLTRHMHLAVQRLAGMGDSANV